LVCFIIVYFIDRIFENIFSRNSFSYWLIQKMINSLIYLIVQNYQTTIDVFKSIYHKIYALCLFCRWTFFSSCFDCVDLRHYDFFCCNVVKYQVWQCLRQWHTWNFLFSVYNLNILASILPPMIMNCYWPQHSQQYWVKKFYLNQAYHNHNNKKYKQSIFIWLAPDIFRL